MLSKGKSLRTHCERRKNYLELINKRIIIRTGYHTQMVCSAMRDSTQKRHGLRHKQESNRAHEP